MVDNMRGEVSMIKMEHGEGIEPDVKLKVELDILSPAAQYEEDLYEDAGDLDFTNSKQQIFLIRLPKFLWKSWFQMDDDAEIHLGTMRVEGDLDNPKRVCHGLSLLLTID